MWFTSAIVSGSELERSSRNDSTSSIGTDGGRCSYNTGKLMEENGEVLVEYLKQWKCFFLSLIQIGSCFYVLRLAQ